MLHQRRHSDVALQLTKYFSSTVEISTSSKMVIIEGRDLVVNIHILPS